MAGLVERATLGCLGSMEGSEGSTRAVVQPERGGTMLFAGGMFVRHTPGACPVRYLCIKYLISSPKFILTLGSPPNRPH